MARKTEVFWQVAKETPTQDGFGVQRYALRADGKLIEKYSYHNSEGRLQHDWGWKLSDRRLQPRLPDDAAKRLESFKQRGYHVETENPSAQKPVRPRRRSSY